MTVQLSLLSNLYIINRFILQKLCNTVLKPLKISQFTQCVLHQTNSFQLLNVHGIGMVSIIFCSLTVLPKNKKKYDIHVNTTDVS
jgi:hypothetical protein